MEIPKSYEGKETEKLYKMWEENGYFTPSKFNKPPFSIVIPPPNVTGSLHMGHALNNTIQDILARFKRMQGFNVLWLPGTDHAGIATQNVVEKKLLGEGIKREDIGREEFLKRVWEWKNEYGDRIIEQLKRLGASCDWKRTRFTMDSPLSEAVRKAFVILYNDGLIYQDNYIINYCPRCQTAISDIEVSYSEENGFLYYIKYPCEDGGYIVVATTRPETMLGDTAVAVNPDDERHKSLIGKTAILPIINRKIPIIASSFVKMDFGTGALKITPAHDSNDFIIGRENHLEAINVIDKFGRMNENASFYKGLDRFDARKRIVIDLQRDNLIEKIEPYKYNLGHCYRCNTIIEPYLSKQWFVKMKPLRDEGIKAVIEKRVCFIPDNWEKLYLEWMNNIKDWCISRQIWWGHRIPAWYCQEMKNERCKIQNGVIVSENPPEECPFCGSKNIIQDEDVLDTWFSSALWPFSTFGWPCETSDLKTFYPTSVLSTGFDIIFFWVARMIMIALKIMGDVPFRKVYIHGLIRTDEGKKMSKSSGNIIDPIDMIEKFGCDTLRFTLTSMLGTGRDILINEERMEGYRHFMNKLYNASRFILINQGEILKSKPKTLAERWIFTRLNQVIKEVTEAIEEFSFSKAALSLYSFFWHEYCDWFLEIEKEELKKRKEEAIFLLKESFCVILRLLHPFIPFITEELWMKFNPSSIMEEEWPVVFFEQDRETLEKMEAIKEMVIRIRNIKAILGFSNKVIPVLIKSHPFEGMDYIKRLANVEVNVDESLRRPPSSITIVLRGIEIYLLIDVSLEKERERLNKEIEKLNDALSKTRIKLENEEFLKNAPSYIIDKERSKEEEIIKKIERVKEVFEAL